MIDGKRNAFTGFSARLQTFLPTKQKSPHVRAFVFWRRDGDSSPTSDKSLILLTISLQFLIISLKNEVTQ